MKKILLIAMLLVNTMVFAQRVYVNRSPKTYYISLTGSNSNDGLSPSTAWRTLTYAVGLSSPVVAGDVIYEKGGNYGNENIVFEKNGLPGSPITVIGYKTTPGDSPALIVNNVNPYASYTVTEMPTYTGTTRVSGTAFNMLNSQYIILKNFQVTNYYRAYFFGFNQPANYDRKCGIELYNCNCMSLGDLSDGYSGFGISAGLAVDQLPPSVPVATHARANYCKLSNCLIVNTGAEGVSIYGDYCTLWNVKVYCNETSNVLDYFINIGGSYNSITKCYVEGSDGSFGGTHGIGAKSNAEQVIDLGRGMPAINPVQNRFTECGSKNIGEGFFVRHRGAKFNTFVKCSAYGTHAGIDASSGKGACVIIRDGASNNTFLMCTGEGLESAVLFQDTVEDGDTGGSPSGHPGNGNKVINCVFYNCYYGIHFDDESIASDAGANEISNCTFYLCRYTYGCYRACTQMIYKNNIYYGNSALGYGGFFRGGSFSSGVTVSQFANCCFYNIPSMPGGFSGTNSNISTDPLFVSLGALGGAAPNLRLQSSSPSRDAGVTISTILYDIEGKMRPYGAAFSIGAYDR